MQELWKQRTARTRANWASAALLSEASIRNGNSGSPITECAEAENPGDCFSSHLPFFAYYGSVWVSRDATLRALFLYPDQDPVSRSGPEQVVSGLSITRLQCRTDAL